MCSCSISLSLASQDDTTKLAKRIAPCLGAGDVILLEGPIGAGKSFFARALILSLLAKPEDIPSPTFTLVQTYETDAFDIWHCDLYRLTTPYEVQEIGLEDAFDTALCLVEWPDRLADITPPDALKISLALGDAPQHRNATVSAVSPRWHELLESMDV